MNKRVWVDQIDYEVDLESRFHYFTNLYVKDCNNSINIGYVEWNLSCCEVYVQILDQALVHYLFENKLKYAEIMSEIFEYAACFLKFEINMEKYDQEMNISHFIFNNFSKNDFNLEYDAKNLDYKKNRSMFSSFFENKKVELI